MFKTPFLLSDNPVLVGGLGGSGTRIVCQILIDGGYYMGANLNSYNDSLDFVPFYEKWTNFYLQQRKTMTDRSFKQMIEDFQKGLSNHLKMFSPNTVNWGMKNPRSILLLPFFFSQFSNMRFIHVVRDGRDMIFSKNKNQLNKHGKVLLKKENFDDYDNLSLWSKINQNARDYCEKKIKENYLIIKFEDLCNGPGQNIKKIFNFAGILNNNTNEIEKRITRPPTLGRWKKNEDQVLKKMTTFDKTTLKRFGYFQDQL